MTILLALNEVLTQMQTNWWSQAAPIETLHAVTECTNWKLAWHAVIAGDSEVRMANNNTKKWLYTK
jgi:hypothetical protein